MSPPPKHHQNAVSDMRLQSWDEYRMHVIQSLARIDDTLEKLWLALSEVKRDVTALKIRVAVWSAGFGLAGASVPIMVDALLRWK
jgi:hypothetical protein